MRSFGATPLSLLELSRLLWASAGITTSYITPHGQDFYRAAPTAGALYPIETYVVVNKVEGLEPGLYHYRVAGVDILERPIVEGSHSLEQLRTGDLRAEITRGRPGSAAVRQGGRRVPVDRGLRPLRVEVPGASLPLLLPGRRPHGRATVPGRGGSGAGQLPVAAFYDDEVNALLGIDGETRAPST